MTNRKIAERESEYILTLSLQYLVLFIFYIVTIFEN